MSIMTVIIERAYRPRRFVERMGLILAVGHLDTLTGILIRPETDGRAFLDAFGR